MIVRRIDEEILNKYENVIQIQQKKRSTFEISDDTCDHFSLLCLENDKVMGYVDVEIVNEFRSLKSKTMLAKFNDLANEDITISLIKNLENETKDNNCRYLVIKVDEYNYPIQSLLKDNNFCFIVSNNKIIRDVTNRNNLIMYKQI